MRFYCMFLHRRNGQNSIERKEQAADQRLQRWRGDPLLRRSKGATRAQRPSGPAAQRPSRQCRPPVPSAPWRRAPAPRAGGGRAALRFGWGGSGSRRRQAHEQGPAACKGMRWATLPCPAGARDAASVRDRRCSPLWGKSASELARLILEASRERAEGRGALPIRYGRQARRGTGKGQRRTSGAGIRARPATAFPRRYKPAFRSFRTPCFPCHPAGRTAGSARTRSRDQSLENPFLGNRRFLRRPVPKNRRLLLLPP